MTAVQPMQTGTPATILIIDVATSGFRPDTDTILEVAVGLVDAATLDMIDFHTSVVRQPADLKIPEFHAALLQECSDPASSNSMASVEGFLLAGQWTAADIVCNRALDFDMKFLARHMKTLHGALVKKLPLELKTLERIHLARGGAPVPVLSTPRTHRAGDEAVRAFEELMAYGALLGAGGAQ